MTEFLKKHAEITRTFQNKSSKDNSDMFYWMFKMNNKEYCVSYNSNSKKYLLSDYDSKDETAGIFYGIGDKGAIQHLILVFKKRYK